MHVDRPRLATLIADWTISSLAKPTVFERTARRECVCWCWESGHCGDGLSESVYVRSSGFEMLIFDWGEVVWDVSVS